MLDENRGALLASRILDDGAQLEVLHTQLNLDGLLPMVSTGSPQFVFRHQPCHPFVIHTKALGFELCRHARRAVVPLVAMGVNLSHRTHYRGITLYLLSASGSNVVVTAPR